MLPLSRRKKRLARPLLPPSSHSLFLSLPPHPHPLVLACPAPPCVRTWWLLLYN